MKVGLLVDIKENYKESIRQAKALGFDFGQLCIWNMDFTPRKTCKSLKPRLKPKTLLPRRCGAAGAVPWFGPIPNVQVDAICDVDAKGNAK